MNTTAIYEIAPDLFRLSICVPDFDMQFNHFLVRDEEPLLFHAGFKGMFPAFRDRLYLGPRYAESVSRHQSLRMESSRARSIRIRNSLPLGSAIA